MWSIATCLNSGMRTLFYPRYNQSHVTDTVVTDKKVSQSASSKFVKMSYYTNNFGIWNAHKDCDNLNVSNSTSTCLSSALLISGLVFDIFSIFGALFTILTYLAYPEHRTRARLFLLFIAIADFFRSVFYGIALIWSLIDGTYSSCTPKKSSFQLWSCIIQSFIDLFFPLVSFFWTIILGFHIIFAISGKSYFNQKPIFVTLLLIGWGVPFLISFTALSMNILGPGASIASPGWCFINYQVLIAKDGRNSFNWILEFFFAKMWDIFALLIVTIIYPFMFIRVFYLKYQSELVIALTDLKLILIPCVFLLLRIWGDIRWAFEVYNIINNVENTTANNPCKTPFEKFFAFAQAIGDPGQGWANAILYLVFTKVIRDSIYASFMNFFRKINHFCCEIFCGIKQGERTQLINYE